MARAVLDTSVLVSALLTPEGVPGQLLDQAEEGTFVLCISPAILDEARRVLLREPKLQARYRYSAASVETFCEGLLAFADLVAELPELPGAVPLDPKDDMIIATAVAGRADYLVTGDRRHLIVLEHYEGIRILSPRAFLSELAPDQA